MKEEVFLERSSYLSKLIIPFCLGVVGGVFLMSLFGFRVLPFVVLGAWVFWFIFFSRRITLLFVILSGVLSGVIGLNFALQKIEMQLPAEFEGRVIVLGDPVTKEEYQRIVISPVDEEFRGVKFIAFQSLYPKYQAGQQLGVSCSLEKPENRGEKFNYIRYLAKNDIYRICKKGSVEVLRGDGKKFFSLIALRRSIEGKLGMLLPEPESSYLEGLLLGGSDRLPSDVAESFRLTGTTHVVAVSGYNITIVASAVSAFFLFLGMWRRQAFWFSVFGIFLFVILVGAPSSAVRAAIMGVIVLWAARNGRLASSGRALLLTATLMILWSPLILVYDTGFQLSFIATIGIVYVYGPLSEKLKITNDFLELKSIVLITLSAQLSVTGIIIYQFGVLSPFSLLANLVILPLIPFIMLGGALVIFLSFAAPFLAKMISPIVWLALHFEIVAVEKLSRLPWVSIQIDNVHWSWLVGYYILLFLLILFLKKTRKMDDNSTVRLIHDDS